MYCIVSGCYVYNVLLFPSDGSGEGDDGGGGGSSGLRGQVLLLKTDACHLAPHLVHLHTLSEGFSLVIVSEVFLSNFSCEKVWLFSCTMCVHS